MNADSWPIQHNKNVIITSKRHLGVMIMFLLRNAVLSFGYCYRTPVIYMLPYPYSYIYIQ